ncbi:MAG: CHRD domain-containing protein [Gemmatimonadaceae bacterium]
MLIRSAIVYGVAFSLVAAGCKDATPTGPERFTVPIFVRNAESPNFGTHLRGDEEVPPVDTKAQGQAEFRLSDDGTSLSFKLIVANVDNVTQSHIHIGASGVNGPVVVFLFRSVAGGVTENGILAEGTITRANLIARPAIGFGATIGELVAAMRSGRTYVNVHTVAWPGGEVRGQLEQNGKSN